MWQPETRKRCETNQHQRQEEEPNPTGSFLQCFELVLPWLTPQELANVSLTSKSLNQISKSITLRRSSDASRSFENLPIPFHNTVDNHPYACFIYTPSQILPSFSLQFQRQSWGSGIIARPNNSVCRLPVEPLSLVNDSGKCVSGCDCKRCEDQVGCPCNGLDGLDMASECGPSCECGLECGNRSTQRGVSLRLKIVRDRRKGWGLFADQFIEKGQFVCEYAGELLTTKEATSRQQRYDELASSGGHFSSALLVLREHLPSGKACLRMNIDATRVGNVARFINHSCDGGNLSTKLVRSSGALLPRLCFFSSREIQENEELAFSYGEIRLRSNGLQCFCGTSYCFGTLPSEQT